LRDATIAKVALKVASSAEDIAGVVCFLEAIGGNIIVDNRPAAGGNIGIAFHFSEMTTSVVAVVTDVVRHGRPVVGYAFNSTGRYACGAAMRARFVPRILSAAPDELLDEAGLIDPDRVLGRMMMREKPGGAAERSIPIGTIETAVWDALARSSTGRFGTCWRSASAEAPRDRPCLATSAAAGTVRMEISPRCPTR
jgi:hypothetical protein